MSAQESKRERSVEPSAVAVGVTVVTSHGTEKARQCCLSSND